MKKNVLFSFNILYFSFKVVCTLLETISKSLCICALFFFHLSTAFIIATFLLIAMHFVVVTRTLYMASCGPFVVWGSFTSPVAIYGCETWTISKTDEKKITFFEIKCYRKILRISWTERKTKASVLEQLGVKAPQLLNLIKKQKLSYFGHIKRHNTLENYSWRAHVRAGGAEGDPEGDGRRTLVNGWESRLWRLEDKHLKEGSSVRQFRRPRPWRIRHRRRRRRLRNLL